MSAHLVFDAGGLIAFEKCDRMVARIVTVALEEMVPITIPAGALAQVWRDGRRQARLAWMLSVRGIAVEQLDDRRARAAGQLCGVTRTTDIVDASVVLCARMHGARIVTSAPEDLRRLDPKAELIII
jgi:hypothetical protein